MDGWGVTILGVLGSVLVFLFGVIFSEIHAQNDKISDIQVRIASIDTSLEILVDGYRGTER